MASSIDEHRQLLAEALAQADADIGELRALVAEDARVADELAACRAECVQLRRELDGVTGSLSWRVTVPLRLIAGRARTLRARR